MKQYQQGEVVLTVMVVMMVAMVAVSWLGSGHMGMMGMGHAGHDEKPATTEQKTKDDPPQTSAPKESPDHQH